MGQAGARWEIESQDLQLGELKTILQWGPGMLELALFVIINICYKLVITYETWGKSSLKQG